MEGVDTVVIYNGHYQKDISSVPNGVNLFSGLEYMERKNGNIDIAWVTSKNDSLFHFPEPVENFPDNPNESFDFEKSLFWDANDAVHAGPVLIHDGDIR